MSSPLYARLNHSSLVALALCCCAHAARAVVVVEATGSGYVSGDNASTRLAMTVTEQALAGGRSAAGARDLVIDSATDVFADAAISGSSFAAPGVLKAKVDGLAFGTSRHLAHQLAAAALGQPDARHATASQGAQQTGGADGIARLQLLNGLARSRSIVGSRDERRATRHEVSAFVARVHGQQLAQPRRQRRLPAIQILQPRLAYVRRKIKRLVEQA